MFYRITALFLCLASALAVMADPQELSVSSPNGLVTVHFSLQQPVGAPTYRVTYRGQEVVRPSHLGLELAGDKGRTDFYNFDFDRHSDRSSLYNGFTLTAVTRDAPLAGPRSGPLRRRLSSRRQARGCQGDQSARR